ncbi:alpha/beta fold hydrolase [Microlunatus soli]|uniref:Alpha/beta hydrolase family protein n=1 Tax=Microlunatus soli TaxID=630515 RepID=A0A1H1XAU9_9ACTN|nr:alpha/beta fold hydrolase [Microlunatus soli]SDT06415.1 Alpha/beta hydrolase family protein [Microlunatus soli]
MPVPTTDSVRPTPLLLLSGLWHGSWCWSEVLPYLAATGRIVVPVDLAGHGLYARRPASYGHGRHDPVAVDTAITPGPRVSMDDAADLLLSQIEQIGGGSPVSVLAHSTAGLVLTRVAEQAPESIAHAIYLTAFMPASGVEPAFYNEIGEAAGNELRPLYRGDPTQTGALRLDLGTDDQRYLAAVRHALYHDVDRSLADAAIALLSPDSPVGITLGGTTLTAAGWGSVPRSYIVCTEDRALMPAVQQRFIAEADAAFPDNPTTVDCLESSHSPFLSMPRELARIIADKV